MQCKIQWGRDQQPIYEMRQKTTMVMMKKSQVEDDDMCISAMITTLFAEATKRGIQTL